MREWRGRCRVCKAVPVWRLVVLTWGFGGLDGVGGGVYGDRCVWSGWWFRCRVSGAGWSGAGGFGAGMSVRTGGVPGYP